MGSIWMVNNAKGSMGNAGKNLSLYASLGTCTSSSMDVPIFVRKTSLESCQHM
jgi:hypothetical protein